MDFKFNLGDKVRITEKDVIGTVATRSYTEYLDYEDKQKMFKEYQIETLNKVYQCCEDEIELFDEFKNMILEGQLKINPIKENDEIDCSECRDYEKCKCETQNEKETNIELTTEEYEYFINGLLNVINEDIDKVSDLKFKMDNPFMKEYEKIVTDTMELCKKKNKDYGSSVQDTYEKFGDISYLTRITDKYNRICSLMKKDNEVKDESIIDTIKDMGNYCFLWSASKSLDDK